MTDTQFFCMVFATRKWVRQNLLTWAFLEINRLVFFLMLITGEMKGKWHFFD